jgi:hypothetical protein
MELRKFIATTIREYLNEQNTFDNFNLNSNFIGDLKKELSKFKSDEDLLRSGGISIELLDRLAHGFSEEDIKTLNPNQLKIKWKDDLENVKWEISKSGLTPKQWAFKVDLSESIDVSYWEDNKHKKDFYIEDGHHRYMAAKILNKPLNVNLDIEVNPIKIIAPNMGYDEFHRYIFKSFKSDKLNEELINNNIITVYHGTKPKFVNNIKRNGLIDKSGYNQGWYMVSTDFESALFHAHPDENDNNVYVVEFEIPNNKNNRWDGYPYLWKGQKMKDNSTWFALMQQIPKEFIKKTHKINYTDWIKQKERGF